MGRIEIAIKKVKVLGISNRIIQIMNKLGTFRDRYSNPLSVQAEGEKDPVWFYEFRLKDQIRTFPATTPAWQLSIVKKITESEGSEVSNYRGYPSVINHVLSAKTEGNWS